MPTALLRLTTGVVYARSWSGTLTGGTAAFADGSESAPSITNDGDTDTGAYFSADNAFTIVTAGADRWTVNASGHLVAVDDNTYDIGASGATRPRSVYIGTSLTTGANIFAGASGVIGLSGRTSMRSGSDGSIQFSNDAADGFTNFLYGPSGGATSRNVLQKKVTGIADNTATAVFTVTVPNANHAAAIRLQFLSSNGSTDAFESSRCASGHVVVARTTGANAVAAAAAIDDAQIATVSGGATHTLAYSVSAIAGAAGASNTFDIQVTIDDSGNLGSNQVVAVAELLNAEATGITIA